MLYGTGLLNPIFLQEFMGYTAWKAGLVLAPRGLGTMISMLMVGQIARRGFDTASAGRRRLHPDDDRAVDDVGLESAGQHCGGDRGPSVVMGIGMGMIFPTLSATLALVRRARADGLRREPLQHDAQHRRRDRNLLHDHDAGQPPAGPSVAPGRASSRSSTPGSSARARRACRARRPSITCRK